MATNLSIASSKGTVSSNLSSPVQSQAGQPATGDNHGQRRSGGSGSHGAGAVTRSLSAPRNTQQARKQNKSSKKFQRFADEDAMAESAAVRSSGSRKGQTSITHLLNFTLPPRPQYDSRLAYGLGRNHRKNVTFGIGSGHHAIDKARYVHANYRFVVDPRGDYRAQNVDADIHIDWNNVMQILVSSKSQSGSCPICLSDPVAPRMAKCGHIFCLACLIRYMQAEDDAQPKYERRARWKKCPICEDSIYISETRPVRWFVGQEQDPPRDGGDVVLRLVCRSSGSTLALPRDGADSLQKGEDTPWYHAAEVMDYARIMRGGEEYMVEQFDSDIAALNDQERKDEVMFGDDTAEPVQKAIRMLNEAKDKVKGIGDPPVAPNKPAEQKTKKAPIRFHPTSQAPDMYSLHQRLTSGLAEAYIASHDDGQVHPAVTPEASPAANSTAAIEGNSSAQNGTSLPVSMHRHRHAHQTQHAPSEYYFYQALLHYYLSPLDVRILKEAFGDFASFPSTILPRVERVDTGHVVDDDLRRRFKYLAHLPYGCEVNFLECDWMDTVTSEVLDKFKPEIERRRKRNQDKDYREEKAREHAEREEEKRYAFARRKRPSSPIEERFTADDFQPLAQRDLDATSSFEHVSASPPWGARHNQGSAYASLASPGTSPSNSRTVWGTPAIASLSPSLQPVGQTVEEVDDGWLQGWERDLLREESLVAQTEALSVAESSKAGAAGGGKKKKAKKITLMSTNVRRGA